MTFELDDDRSLLEDTYKELISNIKIETQGYALSDVRDLMNDQLYEKASDDILIFSHYCAKIDLGPCGVLDLFLTVVIISIYEQLF